MIRFIVVLLSLVNKLFLKSIQLQNYEKSFYNAKPFPHFFDIWLEKNFSYQ